MPACAPARSTRLRAMPEACRPHLPALLADTDADVRLLSCELVRGLPDEEANRLLCDLLERETEKNVCAAAIEVLAEIGRPEALPRPGALRNALRRRPVHCLQHQGRDRTHRRAGARPVSEVPPVSQEEFRAICEFLYRRTGMLFTESQALLRRAAHRRPHGRARDRGLPDLFRPPAQRRGRRDREVHQRLHRQRDLFLPRGPPAPLPVVRSAGRARARQAAGRGGAHLVGALRHRRGALFDRDLAARELARGRRPRHRDRRLRHRHRVHGGRARRRVRRARADAAVARLVAKYFVPVGEDRWRIVPELRESVQFTPANLIEAGGDPPARHVRCHLLPQRADLLRRRVAARGGREPVREPGAGRVHLPGPHRIDEPHLAAVRGAPLRRCDRLSAAPGGKGAPMAERRASASWSSTTPAWCAATTAKRWNAPASRSTRR